MSLSLGGADQSADAVNLLTLLGVRLLRLLQTHYFTRTRTRTHTHTHSQQETTVDSRLHPAAVPWRVTSSICPTVVAHVQT